MIIRGAGFLCISSKKGQGKMTLVNFFRERRFYVVFLRFLTTNLTTSLSNVHM